MPHTCWTNTFKDFNLENLEYNMKTESLMHWFLLLDNTYNLFSQILNKWVLTRVGTGCLGQLPPHSLIFPGVTGKLAAVCSLIFVQQRYQRGRFPQLKFEIDETVRYFAFAAWYLWSTDITVKDFIYWNLKLRWHIWYLWSKGIPEEGFLQQNL